MNKNLICPTCALQVCFLWVEVARLEPPGLRFARGIGLLRSARHGGERKRFVLLLVIGIVALEGRVGAVGAVVGVGVGVSGGCEGGVGGVSAGEVKKNGCCCWWC